MKVHTENSTAVPLIKLLNEARSEADDLRKLLERQQKTLLSTRLIMGHELKRPTTAIRGFLDLALEHSDQDVTEDMINAITKARNECGLLDELNSFFLELLKVDGRIVVAKEKTVNVKNCVDEVVAGLPGSLNAKERVKIHITPGSDTFRTSVYALKIILTNLLNNALAYSDGGLPVEVRVDKAPDKRGTGDSELLKILIVDKGDGIPDEWVRRVFKPFVRFNEGLSEGSGLGLTLVRSLVELYDGSVFIRSEVERGTTVYVTIPEAPGNDGPIIDQ